MREMTMVHRLLRELKVRLWIPSLLPQQMLPLQMQYLLSRLTENRPQTLLQ